MMNLISEEDIGEIDKELFETLHHGGPNVTGDSATPGPISNNVAFWQFFLSSLQCYLLPLYLRLKKVSNNKRLKKKLECVLKKVTKWFKIVTQ